MPHCLIEAASEVAEYIAPQALACSSPVKSRCA